MYTARFNYFSEPTEASNTVYRKITLVTLGTYGDEQFKFNAVRIYLKAKLPYGVYTIQVPMQK